MKNSFTSLDKVIDRKSNRINSYSVLRRQLSGFVRAIRFKKAFTPLEKATDKVGGGKDRAADGGLMPPSAETVRERSSLTGFTRLRQKAPPFMAGMNGKVSLAEVRQDLWRTKAGL
ncbi:MAG: hypothetical protein ISS45_04045, partial [Candidatus Omnitrophica bacterium]|nr:hypothetical protein [Candidatus Omnitrophota bacterium]